MTDKYTIDITPMPTPRPRLGKYGVYNPSKYTKYKRNMLFLVMALHIPKGDYGRLECTFHIPFPQSTAKKRLIDGTPHRKKPDLDNYEKGLMDSLESAGILNNDSQIFSKESHKLYTTGNGYIEFKLGE